MSITRKALVNSLTLQLLSGQWLTIHGPRGIGKNYLAAAIYKEINDEHNEYFIVHHINFKETNATSKSDLENKLIDGLKGHFETGYDKSQYSDFIDCLEQLSEQSNKAIILIITELDRAAQEGSEYFAKRLGQLYTYQKANTGKQITTLISSDEGTNKLVFQKTSPFRACKHIELKELTEQETIEWLAKDCPLISKEDRTIVYKKTEGFPGLIYEFINFVNCLHDAHYFSIQGLIDKFIDEAVDKDNRIQIQLVHHWFRQITHPWLVEAIDQLNQGKVVKIDESKFSRAELATCGFVKLDGNYVTYRNIMIRLIVKHYATPLSIADHYWIFATKYTGYWKKGVDLYLHSNRIEASQRKRSPNKVIGPNNHSIGSFIHAISVSAQ